MNKPRTLVLVVALAIAAVAIFLLVREHQELQRLRTENAALRQELADARALLEELDKLRRQNAALSTRAADPTELARLRADSAALRKLRAEAEKPKAPPAIASTNTPPPPPPALTAKGTAQLKVGESFITGGWLMDDGKRGYALVTPVVQTGADGQQTVMMESRLFAVPTEGLEAAGLAHITSDGRDADKYGVTDGAMTQNLFERLKKIQGVDVLSTPSIAVQPGKGATIQLGNSAGGGGLILKLQPNVNATRDGLDLDYNLDLTGGSGPPQ